MPDFKDAVWHWGYMDHSLSGEDAGEADEHGYAKINGVCLDQSRLSYRVVTAATGKEKWVKADSNTSRAVHRCKP